MKKVELSMDDAPLRPGREYAKMDKVSSTLVDETYEFINSQVSSSQGITWKREDLYRDSQSF